MSSKFAPKGRRDHQADPRIPLFATTMVYTTQLKVGQGLTK
jgi:hypothetical protein